VGLGDQGNASDGRRKQRHEQTVEIVGRQNSRKAGYPCSLNIVYIRYRRPESSISHTPRGQASTYSSTRKLARYAWAHPQVPFLICMHIISGLF
jgi:hypothetical protein